MVVLVNQNDRYNIIVCVYVAFVLDFFTSIVVLLEEPKKGPLHWQKSNIQSSSSRASTISSSTTTTIHTLSSRVLGILKR